MVFIREIKMPLSIRAFTVPDSNGDFNIYVNMDLSDEAKRKSLKHEETHIKRNDFYKNIPVKIIETQTE